MMIGRNRRRVASTAASTIDMPWARSSRANSTMRMAFFAASAIVGAKPTLSIEIVVKAPDQQRQDHAHERHGYRQDHGCRAGPAFVLSGED